MYIKQLTTKCLGICLFSLCFIYQSHAQLTTTPVDATNAHILVNALLGGNVTCSNEILITDNIGTDNSLSRAAGTFTQGEDTNIGLDAGVLLTTGSVHTAVGPNLSTGQGNILSNNEAPGDPAINNSLDATVLQFDFVPSGTSFSFQYVFASEEYPEYACIEFNNSSIFNDAFGFFLTGSNPNGPNYNAENIALLPGGDVVSIANVNDDECGEDNVEFYISNDGGTTIEYDGFTTVLTAQADVIPCQLYTLRLVIADRTDRFFDSAVFLEAGSFVSTGIIPQDADFTFIDEAGNEQSQFCSGEPVFLDATTSEASGNWFFEIEEYGIGGFAANEIFLRSCVSDTLSGELGIWDIEELWASCTGPEDEPNELIPGFEYVVNLILTDECGKRESHTQIFTVVCCESEKYCTANFDLNTVEKPNNTITVSTTNVNASNNSWSQSNWFLFTHDEGIGEPYTPIANANSTDFEFEADFGGCYTLVHQIISDCGICCSYQGICIGEAGEIVTFEPDEIAGISCEDLDLCNLTTPTGLGCEYKENAVVLTWDAVLNADSYLIDVFVNDPACCKDQGPGFPFPGGGGGGIQSETTTNSVVTEMKDGGCFSWQVTAICNENTAISEQICTSGFCKPTGGGLEDLIINPLIQFGDDQIEVYPNPSSDIINFSVNMRKTSSDARVNIYDTNYRLIETITDFHHDENLIAGKWQINSRINNGIYVIEVVLDHTIMTKKILIAK